MAKTKPVASKVMVIRHAEKPADSGAPFGVTADGNQDTESLIVQGWQRAGGLATLFAPARGPLQSADLVTPQFLYASGVGKHSTSERPEETITPLADKLGLQINTTYLKGDEENMVTDAVSQSGTVLICWQHEDIPTISNFIIGNDTTVPQEWPGERFDVVWVFDLDSASGQYSFSQVPQLLLAGDLNSPIQ
jgi:hypothetical protein